MLEFGLHLCMTHSFKTFKPCTLRKFPKKTIEQENINRLLVGRGRGVLLRRSSTVSLSPGPWSMVTDPGFRVNEELT